MTKLRCYVAVICRNGCSLYAKTGCLAFFNNQSPEYERSKIANISIYYTEEGKKSDLQYHKLSTSIQTEK